MFNDLSLSFVDLLLFHSTYLRVVVLFYLWGLNLWFVTPFSLLNLALWVVYFSNIMLLLDHIVFRRVILSFCYIFEPHCMARRDLFYVFIKLLWTILNEHFLIFDVLCYHFFILRMLDWVDLRVWNDMLGLIFWAIFFFSTLQIKLVIISLNSDICLIRTWYLSPSVLVLRVHGLHW